MTWRCGCALALALIAGVRDARAETLFVREGENLQAALDAARPGDVLLLQAGATFRGNFVLPVKDGAAFVTVRTSTPEEYLPPSGARVNPQHAPLLARIVSPNTAPAVRTAPGAHHWRLQLLELGPNQRGYGDILVVGDGSSAQDSLDQVPRAIVLDRLYVHGDPLLGQKRGLALNAADVTVQGCYISDIKAIGQDTQAIGGWNGPGPYTIENNYLEAAGENVLFGGAAPSIAGVVADGIVFRRNYVSRPVSWREPIVPTPSAVTATPGAERGLLPSGSYAYRIVARRPAGQTSVARSTASAEVTASIPPGVTNGAVTVTWAPVPDATEYDVYGRAPGASDMYWRITGTSFVDTGQIGTAGSAPGSAGTRWTVKNIFELKSARNVLVEFNTFEHNWDGGQPGYAIVFTPRGQAGACNWCVVENVTFQYNIVRRVAAGFNILGFDNTSPTGQTRNLVIRHNLFYELNRTVWGGNGYFMLIGEQPRDIVVDHNTIDHTGSSLVYAYGGTSSDPREIQGFRFTNNLARHNAYGISSAFFSYGLAALAGFYPGAIVQGNLLSGGTVSKYPGGNYFFEDFAGQFQSAEAADYRLTASSPLKGAATDGTDVGADIAALMAGLSAVSAPPSLPSPAAPPAPPRGLRVVR